MCEYLVVLVTILSRLFWTLWSILTLNLERFLNKELTIIIVKPAIHKITSLKYIGLVLLEPSKCN